MCGRARCTLSKGECIAYAERVTVARGDDDRVARPDRGELVVTSPEPGPAPLYNVTPGQCVPILVGDSDGKITLQSAVWGLIPHAQKASKRDHFRMMNARSEELSAKPSFNTLISTKRCLVLTDGFYEWESKRVLGRQEKQPWYLYFTDPNDDSRPAVMPMCGLYDVWRDPETNEELTTCTILTTSSSEEIRWLHDRMPVIPPDDAAAARWLDIAKQQTITRDMIQPYSSERTRIKFHKVTRAMSRATFQGPECVARLKEPATLLGFFSRTVKKIKSEEPQS